MSWAGVEFARLLSSKCELGLRRRADGRERGTKEVGYEISNECEEEGWEDACLGSRLGNACVGVRLVGIPDLRSREARRVTTQRRPAGRSVSIRAATEEGGTADGVPAAGPGLGPGNRQQAGAALAGGAGQRRDTGALPGVSANAVNDRCYTGCGRRRRGAVLRGPPQPGKPANPSGTASWPIPSSSASPHDKKSPDGGHAVVAGGPDDRQQWRQLQRRLWRPAASDGGSSTMVDTVVFVAAGRRARVPPPITVAVPAPENKASYMPGCRLVLLAGRRASLTTP